MAQRAHSRLPDELTPELIGSRLDGMAELPRSVFLLRHLDGLEVAAIGARLGMTIGDVERELDYGAGLRWDYGDTCNNP